jgi:hypothetical protein
MRITDEQIATFKQQGFVVLERFLAPTEARAALEGVFSFVAPPYEQWATEQKNFTPGQRDFPWDHVGLNHVCAHPDLIDAAARIIGTRDVQMLTGHVWMKYSSEKYSGGYHIDYHNNTLGPIPPRDDFQHITFFFYLDDVTEELAPIQMVPNGAPDAASVPIIAPAGSLCIYSIYTRHSASAFTGAGHRPALWVTVGRKDRPWDAGLRFSVAADPAYKGMARFMRESTPRQLEFIGFPPPDDPLWCDEFLEGMQARYPGFNVEPYLAARAEWVGGG